MVPPALKFRGLRLKIHQRGGAERGVLEHPKGCLEHNPLALGLPGCVQGVAMAERHEQGPRRAHP